MKNPIQKLGNPSPTKTTQAKLFFNAGEKEISFFPNENVAEPFFKKTAEPATENKTGIPDNLKDGVESLSGLDMSDVNVHYNSKLPARHGALAFTEGENIYLEPGQEKHLPHEAWHVVQQKQGRVAPTHSEGGNQYNNSKTLESEATEMGQKAMNKTHAGTSEIRRNKSRKRSSFRSGTIQKMPIPSSAIILDVNSASEVVLNNLIATAMTVNSQWSTVNWRNMFLGVINQQLTGRRLGTISHAWRDNAGLDANWTATISFDMDSPTRTERPTERRDVTNTAGGTSSNSLGSSQTTTTGTSVTVTGGSSSNVGVEEGPVSAEAGSSRSTAVGFSDSNAQGSSGASGGGMSSGASSASSEQINRYIATLRVNIDLTCEAAYSNWDIINPVKWGAHLAGTSHRNRTFVIGTITYDLPDYNR